MQDPATLEMGELRRCVRGEVDLLLPEIVAHVESRLGEPSG